VNPRVNAPVTFDRALLRDAATIGADGLLGILAALFLFASPQSLWAVLLGAFGAMLPDPLQFIAARFPHEPLRTLQRFHRWVHTDKQMEERVVLGVGSQLLLVALIVGLAAAAHGGVFSPTFAIAHGHG
jgi:hypothetical protein